MIATTQARSGPIPAADTETNHEAYQKPYRRRAYLGRVAAGPSDSLPAGNTHVPPRNSNDCPDTNDALFGYVATMYDSQLKVHFYVLVSQLEVSYP